MELNEIFLEIGITTNKPQPYAHNLICVIVTGKIYRNQFPEHYWDIISSYYARVEPLEIHWPNVAEKKKHGTHLGAL